MKYTEPIEDFFVEDLTFLREPPLRSMPLRFAVSKMERHNPPIKLTDFRTGELRELQYTSFVVGEFVYNAHEGCFDFESVGTRWLEAHPSAAVEDMALQFINKVENWIIDEDIPDEEVTYALLPRIHSEFSGSA